MTKKLLTKVGAAMATGGMVLAAIAPAAAFADTVVVGGNAFSLNAVSIQKTATVVVSKYSSASTTNTVLTGQESSGNVSLLLGGPVLSGNNTSGVGIINTTTQTQ